VRPLSNLAPGDRRALLIGAALAAPMALWMLVAAPYLHAVQETHSKLERSRDLLVREQRLLAGARQYPAALAQGKARLAIVGDRLFEGQAEGMAGAALASYLRQHARASSVRISELKSAPADSTANGLTAVSLQVSGESDLEGVLTFLRSLESGPKLVHVEQLEIESVQAVGGAPGPAPGTAAPGGAEVLSFQMTAKGFARASQQRGEGSP
jgi:hypothetical protein